MFQEALNELGFTEIENPEKLSLQKEAILGKEMVFSGNVRQNAFFNNLEFIIDGIKEVEIDELIKELEK